MSAIIAIFLFAIFIIYGISEQKLVVSLHNIRVFIARMCDGIKGLLHKKSTGISEWDDETVEYKPRKQYRRFSEENNKVREQNLLIRIRTLESEKETLQRQNREAVAQYNENLNALTAEIQASKNAFCKAQSENKEYKQRLCGLQPVDRYNIAIPFCNEYEQIFSITNKLIGRLVVEFERLSDSQKNICYPFVIDLVYDQKEDDNNPIILWYSLLKGAALVPKELAFDINSKVDGNAKLEFLQKYAFEKYFRTYIASAILFAEKIRSVTASENQIVIQNVIDEFVQLLLSYGIEIDYVPINTILSDSMFAKYEVESISTGEEENKVVSIRKYAVNRYNVYAVPEKTVLVINN